MARELNYKIVDVVPQHCTQNISSITKQSSEWYTKEKQTMIRLEFGTAFVTSVNIKNYKADQVDVILEGENENEYHEAIINRNESKWNFYEEVEIIPSDSQPYHSLTIIVKNFKGQDYQGLRRVRIYGNQDEIIAQQIEQKIKQAKKEKRQEQKQKEQQEEKKSKTHQEEKKQNIKIVVNKNCEQWKTYNFNKQVQSEKKEIKLINLDVREKLRNVHKSPSPIKEQKFIEEENDKQFIVIKDENDRVGYNIDDRKMYRYNFKEIDDAFLTLHTQLQLSSGISKERMLNQINLEKYWLK